MAGVPVPVDDDDNGLRGGRDGQENEGYDSRKRKVPYKTSLDVEPTFVHPLLIDHIAENVFSYLYEIMDLSTCFDVCQLWRKLVTPFHIKRADPIKLSGDLTDDESKLFLSDLVNYPELKMEKFHFSCVNLNSPRTKSMLQQIGENIKSLTLDYGFVEYLAVSSSESESSTDEENASPAAAAPVAMEIIESKDLKELLLNRLPNLEILEIESLPFHVLLQNMNYATSGKELKLKEIKLSFNVGPFVERFLHDLYSVCPHLESIQVSDLRLTGCDDINAILLPLKNLSRIQQIKKLKFPRLYGRFSFAVLDFLNSELAVGQLEDFKADFVIESIYSSMLDEFVNKQGPSLKSLELTLRCSDNIELRVGPMPNLSRLKILTPPAFQSVFEVKVDFGLIEINDKFKFSKLETLEFGGDTRMLIMDSLFPQCDEVDIQPVTTLRVIKDLPIGVDQPLMKRIGQLFPNLTVLMTAVPLKFQDLLISVWEYCSNLEELVLNLDKMEIKREVARARSISSSNGSWSTISMESEIGGCEEEPQENDSGDNTELSRLWAALHADTDTAEENVEKSEEKRYPSLDSIFSGIPEMECQLLIDKAEDDLERIDWTVFRSGPSICDLKKLHKLFIYGPGDQLFSRYGRRDDKLSNVFGYSTLAYLAPTVTYVDINHRLTNISPRCAEFIGRNLNLTNSQSEEWDASVYLIKTCCGYENVPRIFPFNWSNL